MKSSTLIFCWSVFLFNEIFAKSISSNGLIRNKRQFFGFPPNFGNFGQSSAQANANAFNNNFGPNGFGSSSAAAQAQSFNSQGPLGNFGASAANSNSQGFNFGPGGATGNSNFAGSQTYNLFNGKKLSVAYSNGFTYNNGQPNFANSHSISYD